MSTEWSCFSVRVFLLFFMEIHSIMSTSALSTHIAAIWVVKQCRLQPQNILTQPQNKRLFCAASSLFCPLFEIRLCGFGVALSAEAEVGQFRTDRICRSGHKHVENTCPRWDSNPRPQDWGADALPIEPRQLLITSQIFAESVRYAAMRLSANKMLHCRLVCCNRMAVG